MMKKLFGKISLIRVAVLVGVIVFLGAAYSWWHWVYSSPKNTFDRMLAVSLSTNSATKTIKQDDGIQILNQTSQLEMSPHKRVHAENVLRQVIDAGTVVTTESIATPTTDFVRYTHIKTTQKNSEGKAFDFSSVVGTWGQSSTGAQLFAQNVFGVMPVANLPAAQRKELVKLIKSENVFRVDMSKVTRSIQDGRPLYNYNVTVAPKAYVTMLKQFARNLGMTQLESVDPNLYEDTEPLQFVFTVDVWSGQLRAISYKGQDRTEIITAYGARLLVEPPKETITLNELQTKLQQIQ